MTRPGMLVQRWALCLLASALAGCSALSDPAPRPAANTRLPYPAPSERVVAWPGARAIDIPVSPALHLTGWWLPPENDTAPMGPRPVVIALHGCGGLYSSAASAQGRLSQRHGGFAERLRAQGWHVVLPDSLTARGERSLCEQRHADRRVGPADRRDDVQATLAWLARQPWADMSRVALVGWSHGGSTVLAATHQGDPKVQLQVFKPVTAVAFYPGCSLSLQQRYQPVAPLLMLLGAEDDWTPAQPCIRLAARVGAQVRVYPDSHHGFDSPSGRVRHLPDVPNGAKPGQGVHAGRHPVTGPQAWDEAVVWLRQALTD